MSESKQSCKGPQGAGRAREFGRAAVFLLLTMVGSACGSDSGDGKGGVNPENAPVTITFLRHDNPAYVKADNAFFDEYKRAHPHVSIVDTTVPFNTLNAALVGDLKMDQFSYDLVLIPPSRLCGFADHITDVPEEVIRLGDAENAFFAAPLEGSICGGKLKGLPVEYNLEYGGVVVNLDKYQAKFPGKATPSWADWSSFIAEASALTEYDAAGAPRANGLDIDPTWSPPVNMMFLAQILQRGGKYWGPISDLFDFDNQIARDALTAMVGWVKTDRVMHPSLIPDKQTGVTQRLAAGATGYGWSDPAKPLSVMGYVGTWGVPSAAGQVPVGTTWHFDYFVVPPMVGTEHRFVTDAGWSFAVPKTSKNPKVAWDIVKSLVLSPAAMRKWSAVTGALPALQANGTAAAAAGDPVLARVQPLLKLGHWKGYIPADAIQVFDGAMLTNFFAVVAGTKTVEQALADVQQVSNDAIIRHRGE